MEKGSLVDQKYKECFWRNDAKILQEEEDMSKDLHSLQNGFDRNIQKVSKFKCVDCLGRIDTIDEIK